MPTSYKNDLQDDLKNRPGYAVKYLNAAAADSTEAFLVALRDVGSARKGMTSLAAAAEVNRVNLYHMLSKKGNPGIRNVRAIFKALNLGIRVVDEGSQPSVVPTASTTRRTGRLNNSPAIPLADLTKAYGPVMNSSRATLDYFTYREGTQLDLGLSTRARLENPKVGAVPYIFPWVNPSPSSYGAVAVNT